MEFKAAYLRISQDRSGEAAGVQRQEADIKEWLERQQATVGRWYVDNDVSATSGKRRPAFEQLLSDLSPGDRVVVWHTDRLVRTTKDLLRVIETGCTVHALHAGHVDLSSPAGIAVAKTITAWAEYEGQQKALRQKSSHSARAQSGRRWWKNRPFGFNMDGSAHEVEAPVVQRMYADLLAGASLGSIAADLNARGVATSLGGRWRSPSVRQLLLAPRNAGILTYNGVEVGRGEFVALVPTDLFRAAERLLNDPARRTAGPRMGRGRRTSLLAGFARCAVCDGPVRVAKRTGTSSYRVYMCVSGHASALEDWVDSRVEDIVVRYLTGQAGREDGASIANGATATEVHAELDRLRAREVQYADMLDRDEITPEQFSQLNRLNRQRISALTRTVAMASLHEDLHGLIDVEDVRTHWRTGMTVHQRHLVVTRFFARIVIHPRGRAAGRDMKLGDVELYLPGREAPLV